MQLTEAIELGIVTVDEDRNLHYNGLCNECKHSKCTAYPAQSHMCMNEKSEWYGCFHVDYSLQRYVDGCHVFEKINKDLTKKGKIK